MCILLNLTAVVQGAVPLTDSFRYNNKTYNYQVDVRGPDYRVQLHTGG